MNERAIFMEALDKETLAERSAYLDEACGGDAALRQRVEALLTSHDQAGSFLGKPVPERLAEGLAASEDTAETQGEAPRSDRGERLDFLTPSDKAGSLGRLGHYEILEVIGRGGMGVVLRAFDDKLHRIVAVKVMATHTPANGAARQRFVREARAAAAVRDEHVVGIYAVEEAAEAPYLAMEYIAGVSLQERLDRSGPLEVKEILRIGLQAASGLAAAHAQGLIHRDVKPANILLENHVERVKITDFGLARAVDDASLTQEGVVAGTPQYMAPEQARGEALDHRADLFSLGSVLYALCTGHPPFRAENTLAVLKRVCEDTPRPIRETNPDVPEWLVEIIARLQAKDPAERFQTAREVADVLGRELAQLQHPSVVVPPAAEKPVTPLPARLRRWALAAAVLICLFGGLGLTEATGVTKVAATVARILTPDGTLVVQVDDPDVSVAIDGQDVVITGAGTKEIRLRPGRYRVLARKDGKVVRQELVTVEKDGREVVRVEREAAPAADAAPGGAGDPDRRAAEYVLSVGGLVQVNDNTISGLKAAADLPPGPFRLTTVSLSENQHVSDKGLASFQGCKNLTQLNLQGTHVSDKGLANFQGCKNLTSLNLNGTRVSDAGLAYFQDCKNLTGLCLWYTQVGDEGLAHFQGCKNLTGLDLYGTRVTDAGLANFKDCKNLTNLNLLATPVTDAGLANFKDCKNLTVLCLKGTQVGDEGLAYFQERKNLTGLDLGGTRVTDAGLANFKDCKNLTVLYLHGTQVGDEGLAHFQGCKNLTGLDLYGTRVSDAGLAYFQDCKNLTLLSLQGTQVGDEGLANFKACKNLTLLLLQKTKVTAAGVDELKKALPRCRIEWDGGVVVPQ